MQFDPNKFTLKAQESLQAASTLAGSSQHQQIEPEHLLSVMLEDNSSIAVQIAQKLEAPVETLQMALDHEIHSRILDNIGNEFIIYSSIDRWEKYLLEIAPEDNVPIHKMCNDMRKSALLEPFALAPELRSPLDYITILPKMLPVFNVVRKFGRMTCSEYFDKLNFKSKQIKTVFYSLYGNRNFSALAFIFMLGWYNQKNAGYIKGGSFPLAQRMLEKFQKLGGKFSNKTKVERIIVEYNVAKGVLLSTGTIVPADYVIGASDGYSIIFNML